MRDGGQVVGRRKRAALKRNSRIRVRAPIATAASTLPAISGKAWREMNLTSLVRGLTGGFASPAITGARPWRGPTVGSPLSVEVMMIALSRYKKPPAKAGTAKRLRRPSSQVVCARISSLLGIEHGSL